MAKLLAPAAQLLTAPLCPRRATAARMLGDSPYHIPVLRDELVRSLLTDRAGVYCDGTLGGGGHAEALLEAISEHGGRLIGVDRDRDALRAAGARLAPYTSAGTATLVHSNFAQLSNALSSLPWELPSKGCLDGLLLDIGVSSHQLDEAERGFSFMREGPLDMRSKPTLLSSPYPSLCSFLFLSLSLCLPPQSIHPSTRLLSLPPQ